VHVFLHNFVILDIIQQNFMQKNMHALLKYH